LVPGSSFKALAAQVTGFDKCQKQKRSWFLVPGSSFKVLAAQATGFEKSQKQL